MKSNRRPSYPNLCVRVRVLLSPHRLLASASSFDDGYKLPARRYSFSFERSHRSFESCEGDLECHPRKGCFWLVRRDLDDDRGAFLPILCDGKLTVHLCPGILGQPARLRRARAQLRRDL